MKTLVTIILMLIIQCNLCYGQIIDCTPDPDCNEQEPGGGALCPEELLPAHINVYYEAIFTIIPIAEFDGIDIHSIRVDNITGLPEGFEWGKNEDRFYVTDPPTRYCAMIYGTTENEGEYPLDLYVTPYIYYQPPFGNPIVTQMPQEVIENAATLIVLGDPPVADFSSDIQVVETGENVNFFCETIDDIDYRYWTFENGNPDTSEDENPTVYWDTPGSYNVSLHVVNQNGENTKLEEGYISVYEPVIADFSSDIMLAEVGQNVNFNCNSTGDIQSRAWTFENGNPETSEDENPTVSWDTQGQYNVSLYVENQNSNDIKLEEGYITVYEPVIADFSSDITLAEIGQIVNFNCNSTGDIQTRVWSFENGTPETSSEENPIVSWNQSGEFSVTLIVECDYSSDTKTVENYITILDPVFADSDIEKQISIYPNPAKNIITIETETIIEYFEIVDLKGTIVMSGSKSLGKHNIDISCLSKGSYLIKINTNKDVIIQQIIIN